VLETIKVGDLGSKIQFFGIGYGAGIILKFLTIAPQRMRDGCHVLINPKYPEGILLPPKMEIVK